MAFLSKKWGFLLIATILSFVLLSQHVEGRDITARASHILVQTEEEADRLLEELQNGASFESLAKEFSKCPSGKNGGDLGYFGQGAMVPEFDDVVFNKEIGKNHKVKTQFGYHLVQVVERSSDL